MSTKQIALPILLSLAALTFLATNAPGGEGSAAREIAHWATLPADGPEGRPLPLTGSWNIGRYYNQPWKKDQEIAWDPTYFTQLIEDGHHVLPTFPDPMTRQEKPTGDFGILGVRFVPALRYCAEHDLPFAFRDWNWADSVARHERHKDGGFSNEETARFIVNEKQKGRKASPIGKIERWREFGRRWGGNGYVRAMAEIYPDPPLVVYLNNNEAGKVRVRDLDENATRFVEKYGKGLSKERKSEILHEGYRERYHAMFEAAREAAPEGWADAMTFVAYNAFPWPKLRGVTPLQVDNPQDLTTRFREWSFFDGAMPEFYMNDWQVGRGKTDFSSWSPQAECTTYVPLANRVFKQRPDYYFASIGWEGRIPSNRRSPANAYATGRFGGGAVKRWDFDRYMGMIQFGLWAMRPRVMREFRGGATRDAYYQKTWELYLEAVDRVWEQKALQPFWKHGRLVENPEIKWQPGNPEYMHLQRWYMLHSDANPPESTWPKIYQRKTVKLRVMAMALVLGEAPERRWMVYAHAPLGAVADARVTVPGYGPISIDVSRSGSFYVVDETTDTMRTLWGGPPEIHLRTTGQGKEEKPQAGIVYLDGSDEPAEEQQRFFSPGKTIEIHPTAVHGPRTKWKSFAWELGQTTRRSESLDTQTVSFKKEGTHTLHVTATAEDGTTAVGETTIWVGEKPADSVVYDVPLDRASTWEGPWKVTGNKWPGRLQTYRLVPNPGAATDPVLHGGRFVDDPEQGRVLEVAPGEGILGERTSLTVNHPEGHPSKTITFRFKAQSVDDRQVLYSEGHANAGFNVYLDGGTLHAGGWGVKEKFGSWEGDWISTGGIEAGKWYEVALVLRDATDRVEADKLHLYVDGKPAASGPAKRLPRHHSAPRLGTARSTRFHDGQTGNGHFAGRLADFRLVNAAANVE